jgi:pyocin large subunit-like protein
MLQTPTNPTAILGITDEATMQQSRLTLRMMAGLLAVLTTFLAIASWHAPSADARKKRDRTPTTVAGDSVSSTSINGGTKSKSGKTGGVLVFPGSGKRDKAPTTIASDASVGAKPKPTLVASATPAGSTGSTGKTKKQPSTNSNRSDPRLRAIGFRSRTKLEQHFEKHGREFGNVTLDEYLALAQDLRDAPLSDRVVEANQVGGTISRFDRKTGAFTAFDRDLTIRTFFKPNGGEDYFRRAATKTH